MIINVIDSIMGSGKTQGMINYINQSSEDVKFMYVTPYLTEVDRIIKSCPSKKFKEPQIYGSKITGIKDLLNKGRNIATTHALFHLFDDEIIELCYLQGYILVMDEVTDVIEPYKIGKRDLQLLIDTFVDIDEETGLVTWKEEAYDYEDDKFWQERLLCDLKCLYLYSGNLMMWMFPIKIFNAFRESYILTYMFHAQNQKYYYDFYGMEYKYLYVTGNSLDTYAFTETPQKYISKYDYRKLINILNEGKINDIGASTTALSKSWFERHQDNAPVKILKSNLINIFKNKPLYYNEEKERWERSKSSNNIWTTFIDYKDKLSGKGYTKGFIPLNMRATNDFRNRTAIAYCANRYMNPCVKNFFIKNNIEVNEDDYALSEMLQFVWRSGIRDGKRICIYIPSSRMRKLLTDWIATQNYESLVDS